MLDGVEVQLDDGVPYTIAGENGADVLPWTPTLGSHTLVVTPTGAEILTNP